ncbi:hypothetical protein SAMN06265784_103268 [Paraburkholderia susongensis]|uniref:Uncharacterized protein n=1 Tax=Paraburkholderia susongensis TaxID=1515439 RepID=A0A1X7K185_9BURK|nr:hypothetical protein SAMN06265784_103268 [Paraburkholderia susongensis]
MAWVCVEPSRFRTSDNSDERFHVQQDVRHVRTFHRTSRTCTGKSAWHSSNANPTRRAGQIPPATPGRVLITHSSAGKCGKRLVFCDARSSAEKLGASLNRLGVRTFVSHTSLSASERRHADIVVDAFGKQRDLLAVIAVNKSKSKRQLTASAARCDPARCGPNVACYPRFDVCAAAGDGGAGPSTEATALPGRQCHRCPVPNPKGSRRSARSRCPT